MKEIVGRRMEKRGMKEKRIKGRDVWGSGSKGKRTAG